jgi:hypothetical protein
LPPARRAPAGDPPSVSSLWGYQSIPFVVGCLLRRGWSSNSKGSLFSKIISLGPPLG